MVVPTIANNAVTANITKSIVHLLNTTNLLGTKLKSGLCIFVAATALHRPVAPLTLTD
jgi:hypothetical protein